LALWYSIFDAGRHPGHGGSAARADGANADINAAAMSVATA
jgi:hypothetical protein